MSYYKFGSVENDISNVYKYNNVWCFERLPNFNRIVAAPMDNHIELILDLLKNFEPPYYVLYVLVVSRTGKEVGRYQSIRPLSYDQIYKFFKAYASYFETDGRHNIWFKSAATKQLLVYDKHNVIYIYNDDLSAINLLKDKGFIEEEITFPFPHDHIYNNENDIHEDYLISKFGWNWFPLQEQDNV